MIRSPRQQVLIGLDWAFRLALAGLFLYAAWPKLLGPEEFAKSITNYRVSLPGIGQNYVYLAAMLLPPLEMVAAVCLFVPKLRRGAALMIMLLLAFFTVMIIQAVLRGLNIDCGCFGSSPAAAALATKVGWTKVLENTGWLVMSIFVYLRACPPKPKYRL
ncbi:MAG: DoxX family membrane protein [bacterium]|nr:DoxX family membrane protein [bacterium]